MAPGASGLPRRNRLTQPAEFKRVFTEPVRSGDSLFLVLARPAVCGEPARLGLALAKKHLRRAVDRNRFKRLIRESFRTQTVLPSGIDIVVMARKDVLKATPLQIRAALQTHWQRIARQCAGS